MILNDVLNLINQGHQFRFDKSSFDEIENYLVVNDKIALPIYPIQDSFNISIEIPIVRDGGSTLASLVLCTRITASTIDDLTDHQYLAFLTESNSSEYSVFRSFKFDYVLINRADLPTYKSNFIKTSGLWGGFVHVEGSPLKPRLATLPTLEILAIENLELPTPHHTNILALSVQSKFSFERFLRSYHMLELMFDWQVVTSINTLGSDLKGIGEILSRYGRDEISRLKWILDTRVLNVIPIAEALNGLPDQHLNLAKTILFDFGKKENPIKSYNDFIINKSKGFEFESFKKSNSDVNTNARTEEHRRFIIEFAGYCIYRTRCCIAHSRIGEYVMEPDDEGFVVDFAEPLLKSVLLQVFQDKLL